MKILIVTEKFCPKLNARDGGARVVNTLKNELKSACDIMQFGECANSSVAYQYSYPFSHPCRFTQRLLNGTFIADKVHSVSHNYTHILFVHISMQLGVSAHLLPKSLKICSFPMFLTPSYTSSGEEVPDRYFESEKRALQASHLILTPSLMEKKQLIATYAIEATRIAMVPRGVDASFVSAKSRHLNSTLNLCSVGSIKPQKNTLELLSLFALIKKRIPNVHLSLIGPIQNSRYAQKVQQLSKKLGLEKDISWLGYVPTEAIPHNLSKMHFHLTCSACETFGRSIFETLALGLPNIIVGGLHAAKDFLQERPYAAFCRTPQEAVSKLEKMIASYSLLSNGAQEIGELFEDAFWGKQLIAHLTERETITICDFDGTLFHKNDPIKTERSLKLFSRLPKRVICSARSLDSLLAAIDEHAIEVDWLISHSGACISDGQGKVLWESPLDKADCNTLQAHLGPHHTPIPGILHYSLAEKNAPEIASLRREVYQAVAYYSHSNASKLQSIKRLLKDISWKGRVSVFGDGIYDREMITYFDGHWINPIATKENELMELAHV